MRPHVDINKSTNGRCYICYACNLPDRHSVIKLISYLLTQTNDQSHLCQDQRTSLGEEETQDTGPWQEQFGRVKLVRVGDEALQAVVELVSISHISYLFTQLLHLLLLLLLKLLFTILFF